MIIITIIIMKIIQSITIDTILLEKGGGGGGLLP